MRLRRQKRGEVIEKGVLPCADCKEPHDLYDLGYGVSWKSPHDGHVYRPIGDRDVLIELLRRGVITPAQVLEVAA